MSTSTTSRWQGRRIMLLLAAALAIATAAVLLLSRDPGRATSGGDPYAVPEVVDTNPAPDIIETSITAAPATVDIGNGVMAHAQTFNGTIPGPTIRANVGDTLIVHYHNDLDKPSAIHWHGIEDANEMDGTPFTQNMVAPGHGFLYRLKFTRPGLYWYHPHHHSSTDQVFRGLYGMIIVKDPNEDALQANLTIPPPENTFPIVLSDTTVCKDPPNNDTATYSPTLPHVSGSALPVQADPKPKYLCETTPIDENGDARGPYAAGDIPAIQTKAHQGRTNEGQTVLTNGMNVGGRAGTPAAPGALAAGAHELDVQARAGYRFQLLNAATIRYMRLILTTSAGVQIPLTRIGGEGGLLNKAITDGGLQGAFDTGYSPGEILLPPGSRADVAFGIPAGTTGTLTLWTEDISRTGPNNPNPSPPPNLQTFPDLPTVPVMHLKVTGEAGSTYDIAGGDPIRDVTGDKVEQLGAPTGTFLNPAAFNPIKKGLASQTIMLTTGAGELGVDGKFGTHDVDTDYTEADHLDSSRYMKEGDRLELMIQNTTQARHPFHPHGFSIQPRALIKTAGGGPDFTFPTADNPEFRDNVDIPPGYTLVYRVRLDPRPMPDGVTPGGALGRWVFHCHIFFHATNGMLSEFVVTAPNGNEKPDVNVDQPQVSVTQGSEAQVTGTYHDRDGDPVSLTASVGTVTDNGNGTWTWKYPTGTDDSREVFITGTDAGGRNSQTVFQLQINNTPPALVLPGAQTLVAGNPVSIPVSATDPDAPDTIALSGSGLPAGLSFTDKGDRTGTITGTPTAPGASSALLTANDGKNTAVSAALPITVVPNPLTALVSRPERLVKGAITVGCRLTSPVLKSCRATVLRAGKRAGRATKTLPTTGKASGNVRVPLDKATRAKVARSIAGVAVQVQFLALTFTPPSDLTAAKGTRVVAPRVKSKPKLAVFKAGSAGTTRAGKVFLKKVAKQVGKAKRVVCTAHPDKGQTAAQARGLAKSRAVAACAVMKKAGLKGKLKRVGSSSKANRRVELTIFR
jgi:FtsP/CotA-like multicopper oxidase with cupredoxin domain